MLVGVIHLPALPGSPRSMLTAMECARGAAADARVLADAGYDAIIVENFGDTPFFAAKVPAVTIAAMTACAVAVRAAAPGVVFGINVLRNDAEAALSIAKEKGLNLPLAAATKKQYDRMVKAGLGELDKSGIAELTFKGRGKLKRK